MLTLETSAFESLCGGQFTLSTLIVDKTKLSRNIYRRVLSLGHALSVGKVCTVLYLACSRLSVSGGDRKSGRGTSGIRN